MEISFEVEELKNAILIDLRRLAEKEGYQRTKEWMKAELDTLMHMPLDKPF